MELNLPESIPGRVSGVRTLIMLSPQRKEKPMTLTPLRVHASQEPFASILQLYGSPNTCRETSR